MSGDEVGRTERDSSSAPGGADWIDELSDEECMEIFWLYVDPPEPFLAAFPPALLGQAMRFALREVARGAKP